MADKSQILLVDDDPDIRDSLRVILESAGYAVEAAADGRQARAALAKRLPDLLILDIMMTTDTEGFDLAFSLKNDPSWSKLPIVILTSFLDLVNEQGPETFQHVMGEGWPARWMFEKPVNPDELLAKIGEILGES